MNTFSSLSGEIILAEYIARSVERDTLRECTDEDRFSIQRSVREEKIPSFWLETIDAVVPASQLDSAELSAVVLSLGDVGPVVDAVKRRFIERKGAL